MMGGLTIRNERLAFLEEAEARRRLETRERAIQARIQVQEEEALKQRLRERSKLRRHSTDYFDNNSHTMDSAMENISPLKNFHSEKQAEAENDLVPTKKADMESEKPVTREATSSQLYISSSQNVKISGSSVSSGDSGLKPPPTKPQQKELPDLDLFLPGFGTRSRPRQVTETHLGKLGANENF
jgi:hypothetical protein